MPNNKIVVFLNMNDNYWSLYSFNDTKIYTNLFSMLLITDLRIVGKIVLNGFL